MPPEALGHALSPHEDDTVLDLASASAWDVATRYHDFKSRLVSQEQVRKARRISAEAILDRARNVLGSVVHASRQTTSPLGEIPAAAIDIEIDLDETLEHSPFGASQAALTAEDLWMTYQLHREQPVVLTVDTSLSMTGEKLALTAVALAVVLLQFPEDPIGIVAFENEARVLKRPDERISIQQLVERFLDVPAKGYTHLEDGLRAGLKLAKSASRMAGGRPASTLILTDGKYTAGRDPAYLAPRFSHLVVLKMGRERASLELCREMARKGRGALREVTELEALPTAMYTAVKDILRGRSLS